jgi:uncharacterized protein
LLIGAGTALNVGTVLVGATAGVLIGHRLPERTREVVTDGLGLVTLLVAALNAASVLDAQLIGAIGAAAPVLVVLGSVLIGGVTGSLLRIETRLQSLGGQLQRRLGGRGRAAADETQAAAAQRRDRFIEGFVTASLVFCVGPLTILGSLQDGLGRGIDQLALKSTLDGFAAVAFAASLGWGVALSALTVAVVQGSLTVAGAALGGVLPDAHIAAITATGGLLLVGIAIRLLRLKPVPVGDLLPALLIAPVVTELVIQLR